MVWINTISNCTKSEWFEWFSRLQFTLHTILVQTISFFYFPDDENDGYDAKAPNPPPANIGEYINLLMFVQKSAFFVHLHKIWINYANFQTLLWFIYNFSTKTCELIEFEFFSLDSVKTASKRGSYFVLYVWKHFFCTVQF